MRFLPFVPKALPTVFGFLWPSLQDHPLTRWLLGYYLCPKCACCTTLRSRTKLPYFVSPSHPFRLTRNDKDWRLSLYLPLWHASSGPHPLLASFGRNAISVRHFPQEKPRQEPQNRPLFPPPQNPTL